MADILGESRLSMIDLRGLGDSLNANMNEASQDQRLYEERIVSLIEQQRNLEAQRYALEDQLQQNAQEMDQAAAEMQEAERGAAESAERLRVLREVELEMEATKQRALDALQMSFGKIPPKGVSVLPPGAGYSGGAGRMYHDDPQAEEHLATDLQQALSRRPRGTTDAGVGDDGSAVDPQDMAAIRQDIRALIRGRR